MAITNPEKENTKKTKIAFSNNVFPFLNINTEVIGFVHSEKTATEINNIIKGKTVYLRANLLTTNAAIRKKKKAQYINNVPTTILLPMMLLNIAFKENVKEPIDTSRHKHIEAYSSLLNLKIFILFSPFIYHTQL